MELNDTSANSEQVSSFIQNQWNKIVDYTSDDPFIMWIFGLNTSMFFLYWTVGALYMLMDTYNLPLWSQFKTQPGKNEPVDWIKLRKVIKRVIYNQTIVALMLTIPAYSIVVWNGGNLLNIREIPSLSTLVIDIFGCMVVREITFYYSHRLLHHRKFYEKYHKKHHEYTAPVAVSAQYADSFEHVVSNLLPVLIGPVTMRAHYFTAFVWLAHVNLRTLSDHSGYNFPWYYNPVRHDYHHETFNSHYGVEFFGLMDWLHGTGKPIKIKSD